MATTYITMSTKGQVIIPAELRERLHIEPGTKIAVSTEGTKLVLQPITDQFIESLCGITAGMGLYEEWEKEHREYKTL